jgi:hypothetical protein
MTGGGYNTGSPESVKVAALLAGHDTAMRVKETR